MKISEALEVANDIRNGCRNVGEADAIVALADAIEVMSTAERNLLLGCDPGQHRSCTVQLHEPKGDRRRWQVMSKHQRSATVPAFAHWLVENARSVSTV